MKYLLMILIAPFLFLFAFTGWMSYVDYSVEQTCVEYNIEQGIDKHSAELKCL